MTPRLTYSLKFVERSETNHVTCLSHSTCCGSAETLIVDECSLIKHDEDAEWNSQNQLDLTKPNTSGRIANPLAGIPREQLLRDVDDFLGDKGIDNADREYFHKGAISAQNPGNHHELDAFDDADRAALDREIKSK